LLSAVASHEPGRGKRYCAELKGRVTEAARSRRSEGAGWREISAEMGVAAETLRRWCMGVGPKQSPTMLPVRVVADRDERAVSVVSPSGHRIDGLTLREAVGVLRALG